MKRMGVGGPIVLGGRESRYMAKGGQGIDIRLDKIVGDHLGEVRSVARELSCFDERKPMTA